MSRSNVPQAQPVGYAPQQGAVSPEHDPRFADTRFGDPRQWPASGRPQWPADGQSSGQAQQAPAPSYPARVEVPAHDPYAAHQQGVHYAQSPYPQSQNGHYDAAYAGAVSQPAPQPAETYSTAFDAFASPRTGDPRSQSAAASYAGQPAQTASYAQPSYQDQSYRQPQYQQAPRAPSQTDPSAYAQPAPDLRGGAYDQWPAGQTQQHNVDPRGYDLSQYQAAPAQPAYQPSFDPGVQHGYGHAESAQSWDGHAQGYAQSAEPSLATHAYGHEAVQAGQLEPQEYDEEEYEAEEPRRSIPYKKIAAVLAGALVAGGVLMYAYQSLFSKHGGGGNVPVVKNTDGPNKVKPTEPGGKKFDHADSKIMGRLGEGGERASNDLDASGVRRVPTVTINPDGSIEAPAPATESAPPPQAATAVPGLSVVDVTGESSRRAAAPAPSATGAIPDAGAAAAAAPDKPASEKPVIISRTETPPPAAKPAPEAPSAPDPAPPAAAKKTTTPPAATATAPAKKVATTTPAPSAGGSTGVYVAVLASIPATSKSRQEAIALYADLSQKYGSLLQNQTPDVQEANLGEKGVYHRLVVGPLGSKDSAQQLCNQLKAAGHPDCWPKSY